MALFDGESGYPLALMDSTEITALRTGAATAVAAKYLARPDSKVATVCGCGVQGRIQLKSLAQVLRLEKAYAYDEDAVRAGECPCCRTCPEERGVGGARCEGLA
ncbi:MAG: hypothetical protein LC800_15045 [Acidobacteria bacterium]|nr:hypothetical protein [Acidobacteriota bacterium]